MRKTVILCVFLTILAGASCRSTKSVPLNLDPLLKCGDYDLREGYLTVPYNGCIYDPNGTNSFGNATVYLLPAKGAVAYKKMLQQQYGELAYEKETARVNAISVEELRTEFIVVCFLVDTASLQHMENAELRYVPRSAYTVKAFKAFPQQDWQLLDSFEVDGDEDLPKEVVWEQSVLGADYPMNISGETLPAEDPVLRSASNYSTFDSVSFDLDGDSYEDKLVFWEPNEKRSAGGSHDQVTYKLFKGIGPNQYRLWTENANLLLSINPNCPAEGYQRTVVTVPYFTIEQQQCYNFMYVDQFITFRYDAASQKILLHKFGERYTLRGGDDDENQKQVPEERLLTLKDFGRLPFEKVRISDLVQMNLDKIR